MQQWIIFHAMWKFGLSVWCWMWSSPFLRSSEYPMLSLFVSHWKQGPSFWCLLHVLVLVYCLKQHCCFTNLCSQRPPLAHNPCASYASCMVLSTVSALVTPSSTWKSLAINWAPNEYARLLAFLSLHILAPKRCTVILYSYVCLSLHFSTIRSRGSSDHSLGLETDGTFF